MSRLPQHLLGFIGCVAAMAVSLGAIWAAGADATCLAGPDPLSSLSLPDPRTLDASASSRGWTLCMDDAPGHRSPRADQRGAILQTHDGSQIVVTTQQFAAAGAARQALGELAQGAVMQLRPVVPPAFEEARRCAALALVFDADEPTHALLGRATLPTRYALVWVNGDTLTAFYGPTLDHVLMANPRSRAAN